MLQTEEILRMIIAKRSALAASSRPLEPVPEETSKQTNAEGVHKDKKRHCMEGEGDIGVPQPSEDLVSGISVGKQEKDQFISYEEGEERHHRELSEAKEGRAEAEKKVSEVLDKERVATDKVSELLAQSVKWNTERDSFTASLNDQKFEIKEMYDGDVEKLTQEKIALSTKLIRIRAKVSKSFEKGYRACWNRLAAAGVDMSEHTFEKYCGSLADAESSSSNNPRNEK